MQSYYCFCRLTYLIWNSCRQLVCLESSCSRGGALKGPLYCAAGMQRNMAWYLLRLIISIYPVSPFSADPRCAFNSVNKQQSLVGVN